MKEIATILAVLISLFGYVPYIRDCIRGKTKPHIISWFTWALISYLAFGLQLSNGGGAGSLINLYMGLVCTLIFIFGLRNGNKDIKRIDIVAFVLALISIVLWLVVQQPLWSMILVVFIDVMSFLPTIRKSWSKPGEETLVTWGLSCVKNALSIYALENYTLITVMYPMYSLLANTFFVAMLVLRRKSIAVILRVTSIEQIHSGDKGTS